MDQDAIADSRVRQPVRAIQPAANGAGVSIDLFGKWLKVEKTFKKIGIRHFAPALSQRVTMQVNLRTARAVSATKRSNIES
jgi:hypothetical protein